MFGCSTRAAGHGHVSALPAPPRCTAGGVLRIKPSLESRLGAVQREAVLASYATAALLANKVDVAKEAVRSVLRAVLLRCCCCCCCCYRLPMSCRQGWLLLVANAGCQRWSCCAAHAQCGGGGGGHSLATPVPVPPCATLGRAHAVSCRLATAAPTAAPPTAAGPWRSSCLAHPSRPCCRRRCWQGRASLGRQTLRWRLWRRRTPALRPRRSCCARSWRRRPAMRSRHCSTCR